MRAWGWGGRARGGSPGPRQGQERSGPTMGFEQNMLVHGGRPRGGAEGANSSHACVPSRRVSYLAVYGGAKWWCMAGPRQPGRFSTHAHMREGMDCWAAPHARQMHPHGCGSLSWMSHAGTLWHAGRSHVGMSHAGTLWHAGTPHAGASWHAGTSHAGTSHEGTSHAGTPWHAGTSSHAGTSWHAGTSHAGTSSSGLACLCVCWRVSLCPPLGLLALEPCLPASARAFVLTHPSYRTPPSRHTSSGSAP
eukprot:355827-Chlamydomonas_euryale.AAC.19